MLYIFSKTNCGPCILVKKYLKVINDQRAEQIQELLLDDGEDENIATAKKYGINATPTLIVVDENGEKLEHYEGGVPITQNIVKLLEKYV